MADIVDTHKLVLVYVQMNDFYTSLPYRSTLEDLIVSVALAARRDGREHGGRGHMVGTLRAGGEMEGAGTSNAFAQPATLPLLVLRPPHHQLPTCPSERTF